MRYSARRATPSPSVFIAGGRVADALCRTARVRAPRAVAALTAGRFDATLRAAPEMQRARATAADRRDVAE